jgi:hypothetical protein
MCENWSWHTQRNAFSFGLKTGSDSNKRCSKRKLLDQLPIDLWLRKKTAWHATKQALQNSNDAKAELTQELESTKASLTATHDKVTNKSAALDIIVIQEQQAKTQMMIADEKLKAAEEKLRI